MMIDWTTSLPPEIGYLRISVRLVVIPLFQITIDLLFVSVSWKIIRLNYFNMHIPAGHEQQSVCRQPEEMLFHICKKGRDPGSTAETAPPQAADTQQDDPDIRQFMDNGGHSAVTADYLYITPAESTGRIKENIIPLFQSVHDLFYAGKNLILCPASADGKIRDNNGTNHSGHGHHQWMIELIFVCQGSGSKPVIQTTQDNNRIDQGLVIGQKQDGTPIIFYLLKPCKMDPIPEAQQKRDDPV